MPFLIFLAVDDPHHPLGPPPCVVAQVALHPEVLERTKGESKGLCGCCGAEVEETCGSNLTHGHPGHLSIIADVDSLRAYPVLLNEVGAKGGKRCKVGCPVSLKGNSPPSRSRLSSSTT